MGLKLFSAVTVSVVLWLFLVNDSKANVTNDGGVTFCYYDSASNARSGYARFGISDIPLDVCTHVIYSFIVPTADGNISFSEPQGTVEGKSNTFEDFVALKDAANASNVKLMASLGGLEAGSANFSIVVNNYALRKTIIDTLRTFVTTNNLDGIDVLWQYPTLNGGAATDKVKFTSFIHDLKTAFGGQYLLTAAVGPTQLQINESYYVQEMNQYLDYINIMAYDFHDGSENVTGVNAPLYAQNTDTAEDAASNVNASVYTWIANGASPSKLVLGLGAFGKTFELVSLNETDTGAPAVGDGAAGLTGVEGQLSYLEICTEQLNDSDAWEITEINSSYAYANKDLFWVGYDNVNTMFAKGQYAKEMGLAGIGFWSLDLADFNGACGEEYLLLKSAVSGYETAEVSNSTAAGDSAANTTDAAETTKPKITIITDDSDETDATDDTTNNGTFITFPVEDLLNSGDNITFVNTSPIPVNDISDDDLLELCESADFDDNSGNDDETNADSDQSADEIKNDGTSITVPVDDLLNSGDNITFVNTSPIPVENNNINAADTDESSSKVNPLDLVSAIKVDTEKEEAPKKKKKNIFKKIFGH